MPGVVANHSRAGLHVLAFYRAIALFCRQTRTLDETCHPWRAPRQGSNVHRRRRGSIFCGSAIRTSHSCECVAPTKYQRMCRSGWRARNMRMWASPALET